MNDDARDELLATEADQAIDELATDARDRAAAWRRARSSEAVLAQWDDAADAVPEAQTGWGW